MRALALLVATAWAPLLAQDVVAGPQVSTFRSTVDGAEQPYALYVPRGFDPARKYPLVMSLHAEETNHRVNLPQLFGTSPRDYAGSGSAFPRLLDVDFIVACPFARSTMGYQGIPERDIYDVLADVKRRFPIDEDRIYLTGVSMGGGGALRLALTRPDIWAAVAPVCPATIPGTEELAPNALNLPIRLFHGEMDPAVPAASSRAWQKRLLDAGAPVEYIEYPGVRHNAWDPAYQRGSIFQWFAPLRRNRAPERVRLVTRSYEYGSAYWLTIDGLTPGTLASVDARLVSRKEARVTTDGVSAFRIAPEALDLPGTINIDGTPLRLRQGSALSFVKTSGRWREGSPQPDGKRLSQEGPIASALAGRHVYVYGTADNPSPEVAAARRAVAERASDWSNPPFAPVPVKPSVKADSAVTAADIDSSNLILFGTQETNSLIARFAPGFPLSLNAGAADYGLIFIAPAGKRYALVNSGLPWWTGAEAAERGGDPFAPPMFRLLTTMPDFVFFKGSLAGVAAEGHFDRNWKVPAEAAEIMRATGTVTIR